MKASKNALALIKHFEGCRLEAYPDPGSVDGKPWTIGYGHTGRDVVRGLRWTQAQADAALAVDIVEFERGVNSLVKVELSQGQFDALVSFSFNCGLDIDSDKTPEGLGDSTLLIKLNSGDYIGAAGQFWLWRKNDGKELLGLKRRRLAEKLLFLTGDIKLALAEADKIKQ